MRKLTFFTEPFEKTSSQRAFEIGHFRVCSAREADLVSDEVKRASVVCLCPGSVEAPCFL